MSASRRAPKPRYVLTEDRDRIALVAGAACGFLVMLLSIVVQRHAVVETIFRALVALIVVYIAARLVIWLFGYLLETQSVVQPDTTDTEVEEQEPE